MTWTFVIDIGNILKERFIAVDFVTFMTSAAVGAAGAIDWGGVGACVAAANFYYVYYCF